MPRKRIPREGRHKVLNTAEEGDSLDVGADCHPPKSARIALRENGKDCIDANENGVDLELDALNQPQTAACSGASIIDTAVEGDSCNENEAEDEPQTAARLPRNSLNNGSASVVHDSDDADGSDEFDEHLNRPQPSTRLANGHASVSKMNASGMSSTSRRRTAAPPVPKTRLVITHITCDNFKSYLGKHTLGPFHKNYTSIVGPNGSGKSNVIDSMLFVFGFRSQKIRSKKVSALIHQSKGHMDLQYCSVDVHFELIEDKTQDEFVAVPDSKFSIGRMAYADNSSSYHVVRGGHKKKVQFSDVTSLLREYSIDIDHNRFLILQGEVEQIALMKPKAPNENEEGMLEYMEDIIGSAALKKPIEELAQRVEQLNDERQEKLNRVKAVEKERDDLEGVKNEAVQFLKMENALTKDRHKLFQVHLHKSQRDAERARNVRDQEKDVFEKAAQELEQIKSNVKKKKEDLKAVHGENEKISTKMDQLKGSFTELEQQDQRLKLDRKHAQKRVIKAQQMLAKEQEELEQHKMQPDRSEKEIAKLTKKIEELEIRRAELEQELQAGTQQLEKETKGMQAEKDKHENKLIDLKKAVNETKSKHDLAKQELDICLSGQTKEKERLKELQKQLDDVTRGVQEKTELLAKLKDQLPRAEDALQQAQTEKQQNNDKAGQLSEELRVNRRKAEEAREGIQSSRSKNRVLDELKKAQRNGKLEGIYGRLGDLGSIDPKYDIAISTCCGPLDYIVVDTIDSAQRCVEYLKAHNFGQATFIGLDKQEMYRSQTKQKIKTPENVHRLFDLIKVRDQDVLTAFYFALRDTLVVDDLEQATRIGMGAQRWRVVTLGGELIETAGTMAGGGSRPSRGRMGTTVKDGLQDDVLMSDEELAALDARVVEQGQRLEAARQRYGQLESNIAHLTKEVHTKRNEIQKCDLDLKGLVDREKALQRHIAKQEQVASRSDPNAGAAAELEKRLAIAVKDLDNATEKADAVECEVKRIHEQIMRIQEKLVGSKDKLLCEIKKELASAQKGVTKAKVAATNAQRNVEKSEQRIVTLQQEIKENEECVKEIAQKLVALEDQGVDITNKLDLITKEKEALQQRVQDVRKELRLYEEEEQRIASESIDVKARFEKAEQQLKDASHKAHYWEKELKKLKLHTFDEDLLGKRQSTVPIEVDATSADTPEATIAPMETEPTEEGAQSGAPDKSTDDALPILQPEQLQQINEEQLKYKITVAEERLAKMRPNLAAIEEYRRKMKDYLSRVKELDRVTTERDRCRKEHDDKRKQRLDMFLAGFSTISYKLKEMYQTITLGGDAELELVDSMDPFSEGVVFSVRPPKKSWKQISNLSGGEKTLSSLSLIFALHHYKPTPFYVMDEIDAALDFRNVSIVANYIKERTKNAQFIIISLRNNMFELADRLVGIYKTFNCTKSVVIDPRLITLPLMATTAPPQGSQETCASIESGSQATTTSESSQQQLQAACA